MRKRGERATRFGAGLLVLVLVLTMVPAVTAADAVSIYDIQFTLDPTGDSPYKDLEVTTQGVVTAAFADYVFIQDGPGPWTGLTLYRPNGAMAVGDLVEVTGSVSEYYNLTEIAYGEVVVVSSGNPPPAAEILPTGDVSQEGWESVFVRVEAVAVTDEDLGFGEWAIDDGSGEVVVDDLGSASITYSPTNGDLLDYVQGPLIYTFSAFKIEPRDDGDIGLSGVAPEVAINEVRIDQPGGDIDEYFELAGEAGTALAGLSYVVIGDGTGGSGVVEAVVDLSGASVPASGLFVAAEDTFTLGTADLTTGLNFENSDNVTHLLVWQFSGENGDDLDTDDDGVLDSEPWTGVVDCVALVETVGSGEQLYCETRVGPDGSNVPGHAYTCFGGWIIGAFDPAEGDDTPGADNACDLPVPEVGINEVRIDQPGGDIDEYFELAGEAGTALAGLSYVVIGDGSGGSGVVEAVVDLSGASVPASGLFVAAEDTFTLGTADLTTGLNFENSDNVTHLLVWEFTGDNGDDLDTDDDGVLDSEPWTEVVDCVALVETVGSGDLLYCETQVGPDGSNVPAHVFRCEEGWEIGAYDPLGGADTPGAANICEACGDPVTAIYDIQGSGDSSPLLGDVVSLEGVVTGDFQADNQLRGFFVQEVEGDYVDATSDGVFVYAPGALDVAVGETVRVRGVVQEYDQQTEIGNVSFVLACGEGTVDPTVVDLPADLEPYEGMLVTFPEDLTVSQNYFQGRYGQVTLSAEGRLFQPTNTYLPGSAEAVAMAAENMLRMIELDDGSTWSNPDPIPYIGAGNTLRAGDTIAGLTGVVDQGKIWTGDPKLYRLQPTMPVEFTRVNERTAVPADVGGLIRIGSFNVLNYFNGDGLGGGFPTSRGASSAEEFVRQRDKIISAILALNPDVLGLMEIENDGYVPESAIADLVNGLNAAAGASTFAYIDPGTGPVGSDEIAVGLLYKPATVNPVGAAAILDSSVDPLFNSDRNRPAIAQTFERVTGGARFTVAVNHLKSKGSGCGLGDDDPVQGNCNVTRTNAATALANWLATDPTGSGDPDFFIIGDLNAYAMEDPITTLEAAGMTNLVKAFEGMWAYSYTFDGQAGYLDHGLGSASAAYYTMGATIWHINTDEPSVLDYNFEYKPQDLYEATPFRASDHDPVLIGFCDDVAPGLEVSVTPDLLWPVNHKYITVTATVDVWDNLDDNPMLELVSVVSSEEDNDTGDGNTDDDIVIVDDFTFLLRAERAGGGDGRVYTITYKATDTCGNVTWGRAFVTVPHDQRKEK